MRLQDASVHRSRIQRPREEPLGEWRPMLDFHLPWQTVYMDNFISSFPLRQYLRENDTIAVGTVVSGLTGVLGSLHTQEFRTN